MRCLHSPIHRRHDPALEVQRGVAIPMYETPERAEAIVEALREDPSFTFDEPAEHGLGPILAVHDEAMVRYLESAWRDWAEAEAEPQIVPGTSAHARMREGMEEGPEPVAPSGRIGYWCFDTATPMVEGTYPAALAAVDAALTAADLVLAGERAAYALCRPPGHHAARAMFGGYCFFNNAAIAAEHVAHETGAPVAVLDLDYHHGNGTQQIFYARGDVLYVSLHGDPARAYPYFTGYADETGTGPGRGTTRNVPLPERCDDGRYLHELDGALDAVAGFGGEVLVVSLGFDTHERDPISDLALTTDVYGEIGRRVASTGRRLVVVQEGGYFVPALGENALRWLRGAAG